MTEEIFTLRYRKYSPYDLWYERENIHRLIEEILTLWQRKY